MSRRPTAGQVARWADDVEVGGTHQAALRPERAAAAGDIRGLIGDATPDGVHHLLARADWDADAVRDDLIDSVGERLGAPDGVLVVDATGFTKKGAKSCGVARQFTGTAGRIESGQVGVFLACAGRGGPRPGRPGARPAEGADRRPRPV
jgi:SRSO17 transposase